MPLQSWKLRAYPTPAQEALCAQVFGHGRWAWNHSLETIFTALKDGEAFPKWKDLSKALTEQRRSVERAWLRSVPRDVLTQRLMDLREAWKRYRDGVGGVPGFRSKYRKQTARFALDPRAAGKAAAWRHGEIRLPKLGAMRWRGRPLPVAMPAMVTLTRTRDGRYWLTFAVETAAQPLPPAPVERLDVAAAGGALARASDGTEYALPPAWTALAGRLRKVQQRLNRQRKGSHRRARTKVRLARLYARQRNLRLDFLHKVSMDLVRRAGVLGIEALDGAGTPGRSGDGLDAARATLRRMLAYKCERYGRLLAAD